MKSLKLLVVALFITNVAYAQKCNNHLHVENSTTDQFIKVHEGFFNETEVVLKPGEFYDRCYMWGINGLSIKSIDANSMQLVSVPSCPVHLDVAGDVDVAIKNIAGNDKYSCQVIVIEREESELQN